MAVPGFLKKIIGATPEGAAINMAESAAGSKGKPGFSFANDSEKGGEKKPGWFSKKAGAPKEWAKGKYSNWQEERKFAKEAKAEAKAGQREGKFGAISGEYEKAEEFKAKAWAWTKKILIGLGAIGSVFGSLFGNPVIVIIALVFLGLFTVFALKGYSRGIMIMIIVFLIIFAFWMMFTGTGKILSATAGRTMPAGYEASRALAGPLNIFKQVITGTYDPSQIWNSKTYEDEYAQYTDVGVKIADVRSIRDTYLAGDDIYVVGRISAKSLPDDDKGTNINIGIGWPSLETAPNLGGWQGCEPSRIEQTQAYYSRFQCYCPGSSCLRTVNDIESHTAEVTVEYTFTERGGKQIYVANYDELSRLYMQQEDPVSHYGLTRAELASWQTEGQVGLGIGILGDEDVIATHGANNPNAYLLGISITNNGIGDIKTIHSLEITMPCEITAMLNFKENDFEKSTTPPPDLPIELCVYSLRTDIRDSMFKNLIGGYQQIGPQEVKTVYLPIEVNPEVLGNAAISSFFAKVDMRFVYVDKNDVAITVRSKPA